MILIKDNRPLKEENGKLYIISSKLKKSDRVFCDYDKEEKSVEVEFQKTGERAWFRTDVFFFPYTVAFYDYIGIYDKNTYFKAELNENSISAGSSEDYELKMSRIKNDFILPYIRGKYGV